MDGWVIQVINKHQPNDHNPTTQHKKVVRLLVERGCVVDRMDDGQRTPLIYAAAAHNVAVMRWGRGQYI